MNRTILISLVTLSFLTNAYANDTKTSADIIKDALIEMQKVVGETSLAPSNKSETEMAITEDATETVEANATETVEATEDVVEVDASEAIEETPDTEANEESVEKTPDANTTEAVKEKVDK